MVSGLAFWEPLGKLTPRLAFLGQAALLGEENWCDPKYSRNDFEFFREKDILKLIIIFTI